MTSLLELSSSLQVSGDVAPLHPHAAPPAAGTGVVTSQAGRPQAGVLRLHRGIRVSEGAGIVEPHWGTDHLRGGGRGTGKRRGLGPQTPRLEGAEGWLVTVVAMVRHAQRRDREAVPTQCTRGRAIFTLGRVDDVLGQEAMVGLRVQVTDDGGLAVTLPR